jgi:polyhydroxybutyrate depolymerase
VHSLVLRLAFILLLALTLCAAPPAEARRGYKTTRTVEFEGKTRHYVVYEPTSCKGAKVPLVVVLHGGLTNAHYVQFESGMSRKAREKKFIVLYPEGTGGIGRQLLTWNAGGCCGPAQWKDRDDVGFVREIIAKVRRDYDIDGDRIYVAGSSNGGMMAYRIAAELGDVVAAVASVNGCVQVEGLKLSKPISILSFNGSRDHVIRLHGGIGSMLGYKINCPDAEKTMKQFAEELGCSAPAQTEKVGRAVKETYTGGKSGTEVCLYTVPISHFWPGGGKPFPIFTKKGELSATDVMCDFFWAHPKHDSSISAAPQVP